MERYLKAFLATVRPRETEELVQDHVKSLELNHDTKTVILHIDKRYAFNVINSHDHIDHVIRAVKKTFGDAFSTVVQLDSPQSPPERERAIPHSVYYR